MNNARLQSSIVSPMRGAARFRRAVVAVEFAVVAPLMLVLMFGLIEASMYYEVENQLETAAREGCRLAAMDREGVSSGQSTNAKIAADIRSFLKASGLAADAATIAIEDADQAGVSMDLDNPVNDRKLFRLKIRMPCRAVPSLSALGVRRGNLGADLVFRNARSALVE